MEWEDIVPQRGVRIKQSPGVTVALRVPDAGRPMMAVTIGRKMRDTLGWQPKQRVRVQRNMAAGLVRLSLTDEPGAGYSLYGPGANSCLGAAFHFPGLPAERRRAEPAENRIEGGALLVTLPAWARRQEEAPGPAITAEPPAMPDKPATMHGGAPTMHAKPAAQPAPARATYRTEERNAVLLRAWPDPSLTRKQIMQELQALPGPAIPTSEPTLYDWAAHLGLPSQRSSQPGFHVAAPVAPRQPAPPSTTSAQPDAALADAAVAKKTAKAREMLGRGSEPSIVATHCALPLREVFRLQAEARVAVRAGSAA